MAARPSITSGSLVVHRAGEMHIEDERNATLLAEALVSEPNASSVDGLRPRGLVIVLGHLRFPV